MKKLLIADGCNIMFRSFFGVRPFTTKDGLHTNAVYGTAMTLSRHIEALNPDYFAVAFDLSAPTFRHEQYEAYKGTRSKTPPELAEQIPYIRRLCSALGAHVLDLAGYEADDILGTLAVLGEQNDCEVYILTGDRDALQLITDKTKILFITNKGDIVYDTTKFNETYGVMPPRLVDIKALMGDSSDNIPGVPGIGEKTALKLIAAAGSLDNVYRLLDTQPEALPLTNSIKEKLLAGRDSAYKSAMLAEICRTAPLELAIDDLVYGGINRPELTSLFCELEFHRLTERFGLNDSAPDTVVADVPDNTPAPAARELTPSVKLICSVFQHTPAPAARELTPSDIGNITSAAITFDGDTLYIRCDNALYYTPLTLNAVPGSTAAELLSRVNIYCHDYKSLYNTVISAGFTPQNRQFCAFDTMLAAYVLRPGDSSYDLSRLSLTYLGENSTASGAAKEAALIWRLTSVLRSELDKIDAQAVARGEAKLSDVLYNIELPLVPVLADMERAGFYVDTDGLRAYSDSLRGVEDALAAQIYFRAGHEFNINSPKQLGVVLFEEMGIPSGKKTKTGYSTDADTLEGLRISYEIVDDILNYRQVAKLRSTYGEGLAAMADDNGRIHTSFKQTVAATGRLSSTEPNLQNIPVRTELGRELRKYFVAKNKDYVLVDADYSQIELRLLADISGDETMCGAFLRGADIHTSTASEVFGVPESDVTGELRSRAKAVNFGIVYGIGDYSLSRDIGTSRKTAAEYIENYLATYPMVDAYLKNTVAGAREHGYVTTMFGRRRYIPEITAGNRFTRAFGERVAMNSPIQGAAADIIKLAMINTDRALRAEGLDARLILQVHDELIIESRRDCAERVAEILRREMEGVASLPVPLCVEVKTGAAWSECK